MNIFRTKSIKLKRFSIPGFVLIVFLQKLKKNLVEKLLSQENWENVKIFKQANQAQISFFWPNSFANVIFTHLSLFLSKENLGLLLRKCMILGTLHLLKIVKKVCVYFYLQIRTLRESNDFGPVPIFCNALLIIYFNCD